MRMRRRGPGLVGMAARTAVVAGTATARAVSSGASRTSTPSRTAAYVQQVAAPVVDQAAGAPAEPDYMAELEKLHSSRSQGIITAEEFEAKKKQILGL